jgi:hypothetical protein
LKISRERIGASIARKFLVGCVFVEIVIESEICHIYNTVLLTIKVAAHNVSGHENMKARTQAPKSNTMKLDIGLLLLERA